MVTFYKQTFSIMTIDNNLPKCSLHSITTTEDKQVCLIPVICYLQQHNAGPPLTKRNFLTEQGEFGTYCQRANDKQ